MIKGIEQKNLASGKVNQDMLILSLEGIGQTSASLYKDYFGKWKLKKHHSTIAQAIQTV